MTRAQEYLAYLKEWAAVRFRKYFVWPDSFEEFCAACDREEEQDSREWSAHIRAMSHSSRYA